MNVLVILLYLSAVIQIQVCKLKTAVQLVVFQSLIIALACVYIGFGTGQIHTCIAALFTVIVKVGIIPYALFRIVKRLKTEKEDNPILSPRYSLILAAVSIVLSYSLIDKKFPDLLAKDIMAAAVALMLIGLLLIIARRQAVMQIVGLLTMENGLYLVGLSITQGLPLIIELGVFFDLLVAAILLIFLTYRLKLSFASTDTSLLRKLRG